MAVMTAISRSRQAVDTAAFTLVQAQAMAQAVALWSRAGVEFQCKALCQVPTQEALPLLRLSGAGAFFGADVYGRSM